MKNVYHALFYSHLVYGIEVWGSACDSHIGNINVLQKRVVRLMTYEDQFPLIPGPLPTSSPLFVKLELLKLNDIFNLQSLCLFINVCTIRSLKTSKHIYLRHNYNNPSNVIATNSLFIPLAMNN